MKTDGLISIVFRVGDSICITDEGQELSGLMVLEPIDVNAGVVRKFQWWNMFDIAGLIRMLYHKTKSANHNDDDYQEVRFANVDTWENGNRDKISRKP
jgi:hypothetical protein